MKQAGLQAMPLDDGADNTSFPPEAEINRLRDEMELIGYVISHDLMAPVRLMNYAYDTLKEKHGASLESEEAEAMSQLEKQLKRLKAMLQGAQEYLRLETFVLKHAPVDTSELVAEMVALLDADIMAAGATVNCESLPLVMGHRGRLGRLFTYLIENALKFRGAAPPVIRISAQRVNRQRWQFCVEDNGIGIESEHQELVFRLFQRLHTDEQYAGYGLGLALASKIVASHGGTLWVHSSPGKGSQFFFTLPAVNGEGE